MPLHIPGGNGRERGKIKRVPRYAYVPRDDRSSIAIALNKLSGGINNAFRHSVLNAQHLRLCRRCHVWCMSYIVTYVMENSSKERTSINNTSTSLNWMLLLLPPHPRHRLNSNNTLPSSTTSSSSTPSTSTSISYSCRRCRWRQRFRFKSR